MSINHVALSVLRSARQQRLRIVLLIFNRFNIFYSLEIFRFDPSDPTTGYYMFFIYYVSGTSGGRSEMLTLLMRHFPLETKHPLVQNIARFLLGFFFVVVLVVVEVIFVRLYTIWTR